MEKKKSLIISGVQHGEGTKFHITVRDMLFSECRNLTYYSTQDRNSLKMEFTIEMEINKSALLVQVKYVFVHLQSFLSHKQNLGKQ